MIIDELVLHNFGVYAGRQSLDLKPPTRKKPVILIGGLNGGGKTTLLDAIQLCLFGPLAHCSNRNGLGYEEYLKKCIHRGSKNGEAALELSFRCIIDGEEQAYRIHRSWRLTGKSCKETLEVIRNGRFDRALTENWSSQVDDIFPINIAHLFLFDGEKVEGYASTQSSVSLIKTALENLLGLDIVDQLDKDLVILEKRKKTESKNNEEQQKIQEAEEAIKKLQREIVNLKQEAASIKTLEIDKKKARLKKVQGEYRKLGGDLYDKRTEIEVVQRQAREGLEAIERALREIASETLPFLFVDNLMTAVVERDNKEEECRLSRDVLKLLQKRDEEILTKLKKETQDQAALKALKDFSRKDLSKRKKLSAQDIVLALPEEVRLDLNALMHSELIATKGQAKKLLLAYEEALENLEHANVELDSIPNFDTIAAIAEEYRHLQEEIAQAELRLKALDMEIDKQERELERRQQSLGRLLERNIETLLVQEDRERILKHADRLRNTLLSFRKAVIDRHVRRIEALVLESYQQLLRKTSLVRRLSIDSSTFELTLYGESDQILSPDRLSAGERQLLSIALLWGMAKASGRPLPTAIDTPMGRLDTIHRMRLIERYFPNASHQVILLSTDEEIIGDYLTKLWPSVGRTYQLVYDDKSSTTQIVSGYFNEASEVA